MTGRGMRDVTGLSGSDLAGCRVMGKSTSGGALMIDWHFLKGWARAPSHMTLSSSEAEFIGNMKCSAEVLGVRSMIRIGEWLAAA